MAKSYLSNRQKNLKVGIKSYTESNTVLEVTGRVGIGTTNATQDLDVNGNLRIRGGIYDGINNSAGLDSQVPVANGNGGWSWQPVTVAGAGTLSGITLREEGSTVGTAGSITTLDFRSGNITVTAPVGGTIGTVSLTDSPTFDSVKTTNLNVIGISTLGFFTNDYLIDQNLTLAPNTVYYTVHKKLTIASGKVLTIGAGSTVILDRFNNLDDVKAKSLKSTGIVTASSFSGSGSNLTGIVTSITAGSGISINQSTGNVIITATGGGGGGESYWVSNTTGIHTLSKVGIGTTNPRFALEVGSVGSSGTSLYVNGDVRITGILSIGQGTITLDPNANTVAIGTGIVLNANEGTIVVQGNQIIDTTGNANYVGVLTASSFVGSGSELTSLNASNIFSGTIDDARLPDLITSNINSTSGVSTFATVKATTFEGALTGTATSTTNIPNLTGDVTSVNTTTTLATVNSNVGTFGSSTSIPSITVNAKGLVTGVTTNSITVGDGTLTLATSGTGLSGSASFSANQSGASTFTVTSNATSDNTNSTIVARDASGGFSAGIITATLSGTATTATNLADAANITTGTINSARLSGTYNISVNGNASSATYATTAGIATYASTSGVATALQNTRTFEITGDIIASPVSFNGTGNVSLAATIQPNSVALGSDTTGDYVQSISGTSNQITVTGGTGESSTPTLSIPSQFTAPQDVTVIRDLQVNRNLNVNGNITIGGTSATLFTTEFKVYDPDIVLGFRTDGSGNDVSTDNTANHGGIAIASTEGTPLISLYDVGVGETNPATYKKFMWFKSGTFSGLGTDAWLSNYAIGIGSTQVPNGVRLAAGSVQFTERDLSVVRNINASGVVTASSFSGNASSATYASTAGVATVAQGLTGTPNITVGVATATSFVKSGGTSSQFLKADGSVDSSTYLTSYTETDTLNSVTGRGNTTSNDISVGILTATAGNFSGIITSSGANISGATTATSFVKSGGTSSQFLKADGSVDTSAYLTTTGSGTNLTGIVTSIVAGSNITISGSTGQVTINSTASGGGGSAAALDILEVMMFA